MPAGCGVIATRETGGLKTPPPPASSEPLLWRGTFLAGHNLPLANMHVRWGCKKSSFRVEDLLGLASGVSYALQNEEVNAVVNVNVTDIARLAEARKGEFHTVDLREGYNETLPAQYARLSNQRGLREEIASVDPLEADGHCNQNKP